MIAGAGVQKYGTELEQHQQLLLAVSDILIEIYLVESAILRTEKNINRYGVDAQQTQLAMTIAGYIYFKQLKKYNPKGKKPSFHLQKGMNKKCFLWV